VTTASHSLDEQHTHTCAHYCSAFLWRLAGAMNVMLQLLRENQLPNPCMTLTVTRKPTSL